MKALTHSQRITSAINNLMLLGGVALLLPACASSGGGPSDGSGSSGDAVVVCDPGVTRRCTCANNAEGFQSCAADGTRFSACQCSQTADAGPKLDGPSPQPDVSLSFDIGAPDVDPATLPQCQDGDPVTLPDDYSKRKIHHNETKVIERHYADGTQTDHSIRVSFLDYSKFDETPRSGVAVGAANCLGFIGGTVASVHKHCEYTATDCTSSPSVCGDPALCRETDRLEVASVAMVNLADNSLAEDTPGGPHGIWLFDGPGAVFKSGSGGNYGMNAEGCGVDPATHAFIPQGGCPTLGNHFLIFVTNQTPPKLVQVLQPDLSGSGEIGGEDLFLTWKKRTLQWWESKLIYIDLVGQQTKVGAPAQTREIRLSCVVDDDGCKKISLAAVNWLLQSDSTWNAPTAIEVVVGHRSYLPLDTPPYDGQSVSSIPDSSQSSIGWAELHGTLNVRP